MKRILVCVMLVIFPSIAFPSSAAPIDKLKRITLLSPLQNSTVIGKKPLIKCRIDLPFQTDNILIVLDGIDVTALSKITKEGFSYKPATVLPASSHGLTISLLTNGGEQVQQEFSFSTRHTKAFEEFYTENELSAQYERVIKKPDAADTDTVPSSKIEANLRSDTTLGNGGWQLKVNTNVRYFDQSLPVSAPQEKGVMLTNYLLTGTYQNQVRSMLSEVGDVQVDETPYTVQQLGRRGGKFAVSYKNLALNAFTVQSNEVFGQDGGLGVDGGLDDHIRGVCGKIELFQKRATFKAIHVTGGEKENSYNIWTPEVKKRGSVTGFVFDTDFFQQKLQTFAEFDFSKYDPDRSDEFSYAYDKAYKIGGSGNWGKYTYSTSYEYIGKEYTSIANQFLQKDTQRLTIQTGASYDTQAVQVLLARYNDNVEDDPLYPRITTYQGGLNYSFNRFPTLPMGINYQTSLQDSSREPEGTPPLKMQTDTVSGTINYLKGNFTFAFQGGHSFQNDRTPDDNDTSTINCSFSPGYNGKNVSIVPNFSYNRSKYHPTGVAINNYIINLDVGGNILENKIRYNWAGTYNLIRTTDDSVDQDTFSTNFRIAYVPWENTKGFFTPSFGLMGQYDRTVDHNYPDMDTNDFTLMFFISTSALFSF